MLHPAGHGQEAEPIIDGANLHLDDYYHLLNVRPGFSDLQLLRRFLRGCCQAMNAGDHPMLMKIRRGFEVLRYEDTRVNYYRMHRLLIRKERLRFPITKQREMLKDIKAKEGLATRTSPVIEPGSSYFKLELKVLGAIVLLDLGHLLAFSVSGVVLLVAIPILIIANNASWLSIGIAAILGVIGALVLKAGARDYVKRP